MPFDDLTPEQERQANRLVVAMLLAWLFCMGLAVMGVWMFLASHWH